MVGLEPDHTGRYGDSQEDQPEKEQEANREPFWGRGYRYGHGIFLSHQEVNRADRSGDQMYGQDSISADRCLSSRRQMKREPAHTWILRIYEEGSQERDGRLEANLDQVDG